MRGPWHARCGSGAPNPISSAACGGSRAWRMDTATASSTSRTRGRPPRSSMNLRQSTSPTSAPASDISGGSLPTSPAAPCPPRQRLLAHLAGGDHYPLLCSKIHALRPRPPLPGFVSSPGNLLLCLLLVHFVQTLIPILFSFFDLQRQLLWSSQAMWSRTYRGAVASFLIKRQVDLLSFAFIL